MPRFEPFRGLRYAPRVVDLNDVIAPPYDVIAPDQRARLAARNPANSVLVELPEPDRRAGLDRYTVAARLFTRWQETGILRRDPTPALYPYAMTSPDGHRSLGVIGALGLPEPGTESDVLPHEETLPKPRSDRLDLLRATGANLSPIWGLSLTAGLTAALEMPGGPAGEATDDDGVRHQLWVLDDPAQVAAVREAVAASPVVVADGHHRFQTALAYAEELRTAGGDPGAAGGADDPGAAGGADGAGAVMALVTELAEDQLQVGPIHRAVSGVPPGTDLPAAFEPLFTVVRAGAADERTVRALGESNALALLTPEGAWLLNPRPEAGEAVGSDLDSSLVAAALAGLPEHQSEHQHTWAEAAATLADGRAQAVVLLRPVTVDQIQRWASERKRMPPKSTYFSPKPRTGMVFRSLRS